MFVNEIYGDNFFDMPAGGWPVDSQYYYNILVIEIIVRPGGIRLPQFEDTEDIWYIEKITNSRPYILHIWEDNSKWEEDEGEWQIEFYPHQVIEIRRNKIEKYDMIDYETKTPWSFEPRDEEE